MLPAKPRVVWISRRFWPLIGGAERMIRYLANAWAEQGGRSIVLTARWHPGWPVQLQFQHTLIIRFPQPKIRFWGTLRYMQALGRWLRQHRAQYDVICVSMLKHDAYAAVRAVGGHVPILLRAEGSGRTGDCYWQLEARCGRRIKCRLMSADAFIAPSEVIYRELQAAGYPRGRIHYIPNGVPIPPKLDPQRRQSARTWLATLHPGLHSLLPSGQAGGEPKIAIYTGRLDPNKGLTELLQAWNRLRVSHPEAHLCLVGEGPIQSQLQAQITQQNLTPYVHLLGAFDQVEDLLAGADLFVLPSYEEGMSLALLEAMAVGLPIVATDIPGNQQLLRHGQEALLVPPQDAQALAEAIGQILNNPALAEQLAQSARQRAETNFSLSRCVQAHQALWQNLLEARISKSPTL